MRLRHDDHQHLVPRQGAFNHYYRCPKRLRDKEACPQPKNWRADRTEPRVWELISGLMTDPAQLRSDLEGMIELERDGLRGDPARDRRRGWRSWPKWSASAGVPKGSPPRAA
jgi:hypothetical protein